MKPHFLIFTIIALLMLSLSASANAVPSDDDGKALPTIGCLYTDIFSQIVDKSDRAYAERVVIDGLPAVKATPNIYTENDGIMALDNYSFASKTGDIDLERYKYIILVYKYDGTIPSPTPTPALYIGSHSGEVIGGALPTHLKTEKQQNGWYASYYEIPVLKFATPDIDHYLKHFHVYPYGPNRIENYVSNLPEGAVVYVQGIAFCEKLPEKVRLNLPYIDLPDDGVIGASKALSVENAVCAVARLIGGGEEQTFDGKTSFLEASENDNIYKSFAYCESKGILSGFDSSVLNPKANITRSQLAQIGFRAQVILSGGVLPRSSQIFAISKNASDLPITLGEACAMINAMTDKNPTVPKRLYGAILDAGSTYWAAKDVISAAIPNVTVREKGTTEDKWMYGKEVERAISEALYAEGLSKLSEIEELERARIEEIRNNYSEVKYSGKAYYFSNYGDDDNDGLSPESPKATLSALSTLTLSSGDAVLFNRGDTFRGTISAKKGVTYSAYGYGAKPIITGSPENFSGASNWELTDTPNVYKLKTPIMNDVGLVVFDEGKKWSEKRIKGRPDFLEGNLSDLDKDLTIWHDVSSPTGKEGYLYLRCDNGNPGKIFYSIEVSPRKNLISAADNVHVDNLAFTCTGAHAVGSGDVENLTVTNCEFSFIGGSWFRTDTLSRYGNAVEVYGGCDGYTVENCIIRQVYDAGVTHQLTQSPERDCLMKDIRYVNNVITDTSYPIEYFIAQSDEGVVHLMQNVEMSGNIILRTGYGFGDQRPDRTAPACIKGWDSYNESDGFVISNNIFALSKYRMFHVGAGQKKWLPKFSDNVYLQYAFADFGNIGSFSSSSFDLDVKDAITEKIGDVGARVYFVKS